MDGAIAAVVLTLLDGLTALDVTDPHASIGSVPRALAALADVPTDGLAVDPVTYGSLILAGTLVDLLATARGEDRLEIIAALRESFSNATPHSPDWP